jgi:hypothetical protein
MLEYCPLGGVGHVLVIKSSQTCLRRRELKRWQHELVYLYQRVHIFTHTHKVSLHILPARRTKPSIAVPRLAKGVKAYIHVFGAHYGIRDRVYSLADIQRGHSGTMVSNGFHHGLHVDSRTFHYTAVWSVRIPPEADTP